MFKWRKRRRKATTVTKHYLAHKELAREFVHERITHFNQFYGFAYNRVAIRNQRRCWGSCTSLKNLNFSYRLIFLPPHLADYIIVHELCHLEELNHGPGFWSLVGQVLPDYRTLRRELRVLEKRVLQALPRRVKETAPVTVVAGTNR